MFIGLHAPLEEGRTISLTLTFERAGRVEISAPVLGPGASGPGGKMDGKGGQKHGS